MTEIPAFKKKPVLCCILVSGWFSMVKIGMAVAKITS